LWALALSVGCVGLGSAPAAHADPVLGLPRAQGNAGTLGREVTEMRSRTGRVYENAQGSLTARVFNESVNFKAPDGSWRGVDNTLVRDGTALRNKANRFGVQLPGIIGDGDVKVTEDGRWVAFRLRDANAAARPSGAKARYENALPGVNVSYESRADSVKETISLADAKASRRFVFDLDASAGLTPRLRRSGAIDLVDGDGKTKMSIAAPFMADAAGAQSSKVTFGLDKIGPKWRLTMTADDRWLDAKDRKFPVVVDPIVYPIPDQDCGLRSDTPDSSLCAQDSVVVGNGNGASRQGLVRFDVRGAIGPDAEIMHASLGMYLRSQTTNNSQEIIARPITRAWTGAATWNRYDGANAWTTPGGDYDDNEFIEDHPEIGGTGSSGRYHYWSVTRLAERWLHGHPPVRDNQGFLLRPKSTTIDNELTFNSSEYSNASQKPYMDINFVRYLGERPGQTFETVPLTGRISVKVNAATGNLLVRQGDLTVPGGVGPDMTVGQSYNNLSPFATSANSMSKGWTFDTGSDIKLRRDFNEDSGANGNWIYDGPSGSTQVFLIRYDTDDYGKTTTRWESPQGMNATLTDTTDGMKLTDNASQYTRLFDKTTGKLLSEKDRNGRRIAYEYVASGAAAGKLLKITDNQERQTTFTYNASGQVETMTDPAGRVSTWVYGGGNLVEFRDPQNGAAKPTRYDYTSNGLSSITSPEGRKIKVEYYAPGTADEYRVKSIERVENTSTDSGPKTSFSYALGFSSATSYVTDPIGTSTTSDPNDHRTRYDFDSHARVTKTTDALGRESSKSYTSRGNIEELRDPFNAGASAASLTFNYDGDGNVSGTSQQPGGSAPAITTTNSFADSTRVDPATPGAKYLQTGATNEQDKQSEVSYSGTTGNPSKVAQKNGSNEVSAVRFEYYSGTPGKLFKSYDGNNNATTYSYDAGGNLTVVDPPDPIGSTVYTYNAGADQALSRVSRVEYKTPGGSVLRSTDYTYDALDRITKLTYATGNTVDITYDADGKVTQRQDTASGNTVYAYDKLGRLDLETYPGPWTNDYSYDLNSNLASLTNPSGTTSYGYDAINRQTTQQEPGVSTPIGYAYGEDANTNKTTVTLPNNVVIENTSNKAGQLTRTCSRPAGSATACSSSTASRLLDYTYSYAQGAKSRAIAQSVTDKAGNVTSYAYDPLDRLAQAETTSPASTVTDRVAYDYDGASNVTRRTTLSGATETFAYNAANQLCWKLGAGTSSTSCSSTPTGAKTYTYDAIGNETGSNDARTISTYNARNQLASVTLGGTARTLGYAGPGQAERTTIGGTTENYNAFGLAARTSSGTATYLSRDHGGTPLGQRTSTGRLYYLTDALGSVRGLTDSSGQLARTMDYDPYGRAQSDTAIVSGTPASVLRYAAGVPESSTATYHFGQREYDPQLMRWTQPDPLLNTGDLKQSNRYAYAAGDPINGTDPSGLLSIGLSVDIGPISLGAEVDDSGGVSVSATAGRGVGGAGASITAKDGKVTNTGRSVSAEGCVGAGVRACGSYDSKDGPGYSIGVGTPRASYGVKATRRLR
jgi:RHS repeat-associated protein